MSSGICVTATVPVMKNKTIINGSRVLHGAGESTQRPGVTLAPPAPKNKHVYLNENSFFIMTLLQLNFLNLT